MVLLRSQSSLSLFDIRLNSAERDVVVIRGNPEEAVSVLLSGHVVYSALDAMTIKRITLKLYGTMRLRWMDQVVSARGTSLKPIRYEKVLFEHEWTNLEADSTGVQRTTTSQSGSGSNSAIPGGSGSPSASASSVSLSSLANTANIGANTSNSSNSGSSGNHTLTQGNYELPFEIVIPGEVPESVEGLEGGNVVYKLVATIERGRFSNNLTARKHLRVIRTLGRDSFDLHQTVSIENTWPNKIDYSVEVPSKAVAIGASVPVSLKFTPLLKGLKLGQIKIQLAEYTTLASPIGPSVYNIEKTAAEHIAPAPEDGLENQDEWEVNQVMQLPSSLSKLTQDCTIQSYIKVAHKLKFAVSLINPDGHTSELRASLPIYLFISPNVTISSVDPTAVIVPGTTREEEAIFTQQSSGSPSTNFVNEQDNQNAPPNYQDHIYDRLWSEIPSTIIDSPTHSGESTPFMRSRRSSNDFESLGLTALDPQQRSQLAAGLRALENQQRQQQMHHTGESEPQTSHVSNINSRTGSFPNTPYSTIPNPTMDYFSMRMGSPREDMSGVGSPAVGSPVLSASDGLDVETLSRVPSYSTAMKVTDDVSSSEDFAPGYEPGNSGSSTPASFQSPSITRPPAAHRHTTSLLSTSAPGSSAQLHTQSHGRQQQSTSNGSSRAASPNRLSHAQRNQSSSALGFLTRNSSSRSLLEDATRLMRISGNDKGKKHGH